VDARTLPAVAERVPLITSVCRRCERPWVSTLKAVVNYPNCPWCGHDKVRRRAMHEKEDPLQPNGGQ
jgi:hypothetical protein